MSFRFVKLNNPLMGTEIVFYVLLSNDVDIEKVKLNNPLMGTEINTYEITPSGRSYYEG